MRGSILLFFIVSVIIISGCSNGNDVEEKDGPFIGGSNGLSINFQPGFPISEFGEDDLVDVKVELTNKGEFKLPENSVKVKLFGVSPNEFSTLDIDNYKVVGSGFFPAEKDIFDEGAKVSVDMGQIDYSTVISGFVERTLSSKVCYPYSTSANVEVCITSKRTEELGSKNTCDYTGEKIRSGQVSSGPIQVTTFTEELRGLSQIIFKIGIQNKGTGSVFSTDGMCEDFERLLGKQQHENKIYVELSPQNIKCSFSSGQNYAGQITLEGNQEKVLVCTLDVEEGSKFTQGVTVTLDYKYVEVANTRIKILSNQ